MNLTRSIWWKFRAILVEKYQVPFTWNCFASGHGKGAVDGIGEEPKSIFCQQVLTKMKDVTVQDALDFTKVSKTNLHHVTTHLMAKEQLQKVQNLDLWIVSLEVKRIS